LFRRVSQPVRRFIESLFGHPEGVHRRWHATIKDHLADNLGNFFPGDANVQCPRDMSFNHLRTVSQHHQRRDGAEAAGFQVHSRAVVYLAVDDRVNQAHNLWRQFGHGRWRDRVVIGTVIALPEIHGSLVQVFCEVVRAQSVS